MNVREQMKSNANGGFTLIELMIVVGVIAILSSIAYGSYQDSVRKAKRAEAKTALLEAAQRFERCYTANGQYNTDLVKTCSVVDSSDALTDTSTTNGHYTLAVSDLTATTFTLTATVVLTDPQCTVFTLTHTGAKTSEDDGGAASTGCW